MLRILLSSLSIVCFISLRVLRKAVLDLRKLIVMMRAYKPTSSAVLMILYSGHLHPIAIITQCLMSCAMSLAYTSHKTR